MKQILKPNSLLFFLFLSLLISCSGDDSETMPDPDPVGVVVKGCDTFIESLPSLNTATLDFECKGNPFSEEGALSSSNLTGTWGRFGGPDGSAFLKLSYANNPAGSDINNSSKVLGITENGGIEVWAGFFFNLNEKVNFPNGQEAISIDVYSTAPGQNVLLKLEDSQNSDNFKEVSKTTTKTGAWEKLVYNFSADDSNKFNRVVMIVANGTQNTAETTYQIDNISFSTPEEVAALSEPMTAAVAPTLNASGVLSIFSDSYTDVADTDFNPNWGQSTAVSKKDLDGNTVLKYANLNYQGTAFAAALNVSSYTSLHIDYWTADANALNFFLISSDKGSGAVEKAKGLDLTNLGQWNSIDILLSDFSPVDLSDIIQFKVDGNGTVYFDNIYFK